MVATWRTCALVVVVLLGSVLVSTPLQAQETWLSAVGMDPSTVVALQYYGDPDAAGLLEQPISGFPRQGDDALVLSTGRVQDIYGVPEDFASTDLPEAPPGVDGNDMTQVHLQLDPPSGASCFGFDFVFLSEEYPEYVGSSFNDVFTAELNDSEFSIDDSEITAPNNFAFDTQDNLISINTVFGMGDATGTAMNGTTGPLAARTPIATGGDGTMHIIFTIQDIGDSVFDSAVILDDFRWLYGHNCSSGADDRTDTDGDALPDRWEIEGVDLNGDGTIDLDLPAMGADPERMNIFVQIDWMEKDPTCIWKLCWGGRSFRPQQSALDDVVDAFANAPVDNPDGSSGITLHLDAGPDSIMNPETGESWGTRSRAKAVPYTRSLGEFTSEGLYDWSEFDAIKQVAMQPERRDVFHYALYADRYAGSDSSGLSRGIPGGDFLVTDGAWSDGFTRTQERGTFMHEFGHNLGLQHGGDTGEEERTGYLSIMSYSYQLIGLPPDARVDYSRGSPFVDWDHITFDGGSIGEPGISGPPIMTTEPDSITVEQARDKDIYAGPGDGLVTFHGPSVLFADADEQRVVFTVENVGPEPADYFLAITSDLLDDSVDAALSLDAETVEHVEVDVDTEGLETAAHALQAELRAGDDNTLLHTASARVDVSDLSDPNELDAARAALDNLRDTYDPELDESLRALMIDSLEGAISGRPRPPACPDEPSTTFPDVSAANVHASSIYCSQALGLVHGYEDGHFGPNGSLTRGQIASVLARALEASGVELPAGTAPFTDVGGSVHEDPIVRLAEAGIIAGRTTTTYEPQAPVTRAQLATLIDRTSAQVLAGYDHVDGPRFADSAGNPHQAAIDRLSAAGIIRGLAGGESFGPNQRVTRAQAASLVVRWLQDQRNRLV